MGKRPNAQSLALLRRRVGRQADPAGAADLGAQGPHAGAGHPYRGGKQISMCGLLAYRHSDGDGEQVAAWMGFDLLEDAYDTRQFIRVLDGLGHQPVTVIWDNLGAHHAGDLRAWAATQPWLELEFLPSYAPELESRGCGPSAS